MFLRLGYLTIFLAFLTASHGLQSSQIAPDTPLSSLVASAKSLLASGSARDAILYYDAAILRDPSNYLTIFQRGAAYLSLRRNSQALDDFDRVLYLKPDFESALLQRSRLRANSADWAGALDDLEKAGRKASPEYSEIQEAWEAAIHAESFEQGGVWDACVTQANAAIMKANMALSLRRTRAHCRFEKGEIEEGISDLAHMIQISPGLVEPHLRMSAMLFYSLNDNERAIAQIRRCLHSDPDSKPCNRLYRREKQIVKRLHKLREATEARKFSNAIRLLVGGGGEDTGLLDDVKGDINQEREAGHIHHTAPNKLYLSLVEQTCSTYQEAHMPKRASNFCAEALEANPYSLPALLFTGQSAIDDERFEEAISILSKANEHHPGSREVQSLLQKAHVLQKRARQKDYYKVLGVSRDADERTIKRAYRQLTKQHHPDKATSMGVSKEDAEKRMAGINEAYEVLSDPELKARYDNGDDPNDPESQRGNPFQGSPFGPGGGQQFFYQQGGPQFKFSGQGFNFPGGFPFR